jgi:hypothetical protein
MTRRIAAFIAVASALAAGPVAAQDESTNRVAAQTDWSVFVENDPKECWGVSAPKETVNMREGRVVSVRRGDILLFVSYRPGESVEGEISFTGGYPFADGSTVTLEIGDSSFELFTDDEWAWPATASDDQRIMTAMKRGVNAIVTGRSSRGTVTKDTFSLLGFTAAVDEAARRCAE